MIKRNDAVPATDISLYNRINPFIMTRKTDSVVYYSVEVEMTNSVQFIEKKNREAGEVKYRVFDLIVAALCRTVSLRPRINRFIANYQYWQRNEISFNFRISKDLNPKISDRHAIARFEDDMYFEEVAAIMRHSVNAAIRDEENEDEKLLKRVLRLPNWIIRITAAYLKRLDRMGRLPKRIRNIDGLHVTALVANLGNINIPNPPFNHLYEWGSTSLYISMGKMHRTKIIDENDNEFIKDTIQFGFTIDKRIAEGEYIMKAMRIFQEHLENPELLEKRPDPRQIK